MAILPNPKQDLPSQSTLFHKSLRRFLFVAADEIIMILF